MDLTILSTDPYWIQLTLMLLGCIAGVATICFIAFVIVTAGPSIDE